MQSDYDDARAVAQLPNLDIEILHRRPWRGDGEMLSITLRAKPSFDAFFNFLEAANPAYETRIFGPDRVRIQGKLVNLVRKY